MMVWYGVITLVFLPQVRVPVPAAVVPAVHRHDVSQLAAGGVGQHPQHSLQERHPGGEVVALRHQADASSRRRRPQGGRPNQS